MTDEVVARVAASVRYRDVEPALLRRMAAEELAHSRSVDEAAKRVKRRLHQAVGAFRGRIDVARVLQPVREAWRGDVSDSAFRDACRRVLTSHSSTRERVPHLDEFFAPIWRLTGGPPATLLDLGCGLGPLMLPWMGLGSEARYIAIDVDRRVLDVVETFLDLVDQPHEVLAADVVANVPGRNADVALLLKLLPTLERQDASAVRDLFGKGLAARYAVVSFPRRSLAARAKGMERSYRSYVEGLANDLGLELAEASIPNELVFVLTLHRD